MRSYFYLAALTALLLPAAAQAQLCGTYTIDGSQPTAGTNYNAFSDAAAVLNTVGVSCDVTFDVAPGTYDESVELIEIPGASDTARVRFRAADVNNRPLLQNSGAGILTNWVVRLDGADHVRFINLDLAATLSVDGRLIVFEDEATNNEVRGCALSGVVGSANDRGTLVWSDNTAHDGNVFEDNTFTQGYVGLDFADNLTPFSDGLVVQGNTFGAQTEGGAEVQGEDAIVDGNTVTSWAGSSGSYRGIYVWSYGLDVHSVQITNNVVDLSIGDVGIWLGSTSFRQRLMANNVVSLRSDGTAAIYLEYGEVDAYHNTAILAQAATGASVLYVEDNLTMEGVVLTNNIFVDDAGGYVLRAPGGQVEASDYNVLYSSGGFVAGFNGVPYPSLADFQSATGLDMNSIEEAVTFVQPPPGAPDLHLAGASLDDLDLIGTPVGVLTDVDGDARDEYNPKRGADEGTSIAPLDNADTSSGFYAVAGTAPDFFDPAEAFSQLKRRGMKGAVTFRIRAGTFELRTSLPESVRVGPAATDPAAAPLTIRAANPSNRPVLQYGATTSDTNWLFRFNGLDHVSLENLDLESTGTDGFGRLVVLLNGVEHLAVDGCTFTGLTGWDTEEATLVYGEDAGDRFNTFSASTFTNGYQGLRLGLLSGSDFAEGNAATGNTFDNQRAVGIQLTRQADNVIEDNFVKTGPNSTGAFVGIVAGGPGLVLERNRVNASGGARGITIGEGGDASSRRRVVNNAVLLTGDAADAGIDLNSNGYVDVFHNTVLVDGTLGLTTPTGFATDPGGTSIDLRNNVFVNRGLGTAYSIAAASAITRSDYNNLRSNGAVYVVWNGTGYATRNDLRSAVAPNELHTQAAPITFADPALDLHLAGVSVGDDRLAGEPLASVTVDVDGEARSATAPYMGADEAGDPLSVGNYVLVAINTTPLSVAAGGAVSFSYAITNNTAGTASGDFYYTATGGRQGVIRSGSLPAGQTLTATFNQQVPGTTPPGTYSYTLKIGNFPNQSVDEVPFSIAVTAAPRVAARERGGAEAWTVTEATPWVPIDELALVAAREAEEPAHEAAPETVPASALPAAYALHTAAPNPFAGRTALRFDLPEAADVRVVVYDLLGREVAVLADGEREAGSHAVAFEARGLPAGTYLVRLVAGDFAATQRVALVR